MKKEDGVFCDRCNILIAPKDPSQLNYGKVDYHGPCYLSHRRKQELNALIEKREARRKS